MSARGGILTGELERAHGAGSWSSYNRKAIPLSQRLRPPRSCRSVIRLLVGASIFSGLIYFLLHLLAPAVPSSLRAVVPFSSNTDPTLPMIDLIIAHLEEQDPSWTLTLPSQIPNLRLLPYCANCSTPVKGRYHPPLNKGNEVSIYLSYIIDHYDALPDISIFIHPHNNTWHAEPIFFSSTGWIITHLDMQEVQRRGLLNLRITEPKYGGVDTTLGDDSEYEEGPFVRNAFLELFGIQTAGHVPDKLAAPCCSQFAVTRDKIRGRRLEDYRQMREWLYDTELDSNISGSIWERLWQWIFLGKAHDVPRDWRALCVGWGVCFRTRGDFDAWVRLQQRRDWKDGLRMGTMGNARISGHEWVELGEEVERLSDQMDVLRDEAVERGLDAEVRRAAGLRLYDD